MLPIDIPKATSPGTDCFNLGRDDNDTAIPDTDAGGDMNTPTPNPETVDRPEEADPVLQRIEDDYQSCHGPNPPRGRWSNATPSSDRGSWRSSCSSSLQAVSGWTTSA